MKISLSAKKCLKVQILPILKAVIFARRSVTSNVLGFIVQAERAADKKETVMACEEMPTIGLQKFGPMGSCSHLSIALRLRSSGIFSMAYRRAVRGITAFFLMT